MARAALGFKRKPIGRGEDEDVEKEDPEQPRSLCSRRRSSWAELQRRVFLIDVLSCPFCGERRSLIAVITKPEAIVAILECLGLASRPPKVAPARAPPSGLPGFEDALG
jgi:hypothetical protein